MKEIEGPHRIISLLTSKTHRSIDCAFAIEKINRKAVTFIPKISDRFRTASEVCWKASLSGQRPSHQKLCS